MIAPEYYIDSNVFIRFFVKDNAAMSADCYALVDRMRQKQLNVCTSTLVLAEVQWVLGSFYAFPKVRVIKALKSIAVLAPMYAEAPASSDAIALYETHSVKFVDALIASHRAIQSGSMTVISYDKDFDKLGVRRIEPREALAKTGKY